MLSKAPARPAGIVALAVMLYFAQGLPFGIMTELLPLYLRERGVGLTEIGLLSGLGLAWTIKFAWSPLVDRFGTYRRWIAIAELCLAGSMLIAAVSATGPLSLIWWAAGLLAIASATQDIAIDAATIVITPTPLLGRVNATRVASYRVAIITAGGLLAIPATYLGWSATFIIAAIAFVVLAIAVLRLPALRSQEQRTHLPVVETLRRIARRPQLPAIIAIALLYKLGDAALAPMVKPFWVDQGYTAVEIGTVTTTAGFTLMILGAFTGAAVIERIGIMRSLIILGLLQILSNVGYATAATVSSGATRPYLYTAAGIESFTGGLGTAAFLSFLMAVCSRERAATEYALFTATFGLTRQLIGMTSGASAEAIGYAGWFWCTVLLGIPGLLLAVWARDRIALRSGDEVRADLPAEP